MELRFQLPVGLGLVNPTAAQNAANLRSQIRHSEPQRHVLAGAPWSKRGLEDAPHGANARRTLIRVFSHNFSPSGRDKSEGAGGGNFFSQPVSIMFLTT